MDREIEREREEMRDSEEEISSVEEDLWYIRRLDNGLFTLQTVDYILAWIAMEDDGVSDQLLQKHISHSHILV